MSSTAINAAKFAMLLIGVALIAVGGCRARSQWNTATMEAELVDLAALESGERPKTRYIRIEEYVPRHDMAFVEEITIHSITNVHAYYPIVSRENPAAAGPDAPLTQFAIVVKPLKTRFNDEGGMVIKEGPLQGAVAIGVDALEGKEIEFLRQEFPTLDARRVLVLIPGEKPWVSIGSWLMLGFGAVVFIIGLTTLFSGGD